MMFAVALQQKRISKRNPQQLPVPCLCKYILAMNTRRSPPHHNALLVLEAAKGHRLVALVHELEVRRRQANRHHPQRRRANTLTRNEAKHTETSTRWRTK